MQDAACSRSDRDEWLTALALVLIRLFSIFMCQGVSMNPGCRIVHEFSCLCLTLQEIG